MQGQEQSTNQNLVAAAAKILSVILTPASANATLIVYDGIDNSGTKLFTLKAKSGEASTLLYLGPKGLDCNTGIYAEISGAGAVYTVVWD